MDAYQNIRSLSFPSLADVLGLDLKLFKRRANGEVYGPCPIHKSKNNQTCFSFAETGVFFCFSCNAKGRGGIDLTMKVKDIGFAKAVELLQGYKASPVTKKEPVEAPVVTDGVLQPLAKDTWRRFAVPCPWLEARITDKVVRERYGVFCYNNPARKSAYSGRVMLPFKNCDGTLYGYLGRSVLTDNEPKYLVPKGLAKSRFLFGAHELTRQDTPHSGHLPLKVVYLVESPFCVLKFAMYGLPAVSPFGWSVSPEQVQILQSLTRGVVYLPDRNKSQDVASVAGQLSRALWLRFPPLPAGTSDPEYLTKEQILALTR